MFYGLMVGTLVVRVWNKTQNDLKDITITFLNNFRDRKATIKKIKSNDFKSIGIPVRDMNMTNDLVLKLSNDKQVVIQENVTSKSNYVIIVHITGITENGEPIFTSEIAKE